MIVRTSFDLLDQVGQLAYFTAQCEDSEWQVERRIWEPGHRVPLTLGDYLLQRHWIAARNSAFAVRE
jgi:hypothetical protein